MFQFFPKKQTKKKSLTLRISEQQLQAKAKVKLPRIHCYSPLPIYYKSAQLLNVN